MGALLDSTCEAVIPAWRVTPEEKGRMGAALSRALVLWFPYEIPEKWVALVVIAGVGLEIAAKRKDPQTGKYLPRHFAKPPKPTGDADSAPAH